MCSIPSVFFKEDDESESVKYSITIEPPELGSEGYDKIKMRKVSVEADLEIAELCGYSMADMLKFKRKQVTQGKQ